MRSTSRYREMPAASQALLDRLVPLAVEAAAAEKDPDATLERLIGLLESIARRGAYLALLKEYPQALSQLAAMMSASPWVAQYLTSHPILLDELLDARTLYAEPNWPSAARELRGQMDAAAGDTEKQMDVLRHFKHAHTMRSDRAGPGGPAADRDAERPPERSRVRGARGGAARHVAVAPRAPRGRRASR